MRQKPRVVVHVPVVLIGPPVAAERGGVAVRERSRTSA
jgi:hypothetical protein